MGDVAPKGAYVGWIDVFDRMLVPWGGVGVS